MTDDRALIVEYLRRQLVGPVGGEAETLADAPHGRYLMGTLFPQRSDSTATQDGEEQDERGGEVGDERERVDDPISLANQYMPSSVALSFLVHADTALVISMSAGVYEKDGRWVRTPLHDTHPIGDLRAGRLVPVKVLGERAELTGTVRPFGMDQFLVTLALINCREAANSERRGRSEDCLFQVELSCIPSSGTLHRYPASMKRALHDDDKSTALLYRRTPVWAIGHGCSATWSADETQRSVTTAHMPEETLPQVSFEVPGISKEMCSLAGLACITEDTGAIIKRLDAFVDAYEQWIGELPHLHEYDIPDLLKPTAERHLRDLDVAARRMRLGVRLLETDSEVRTAFALANEAMLMQMAHGSKDRGGRSRPLGEATHEPIDYLALPDKEWRPFQLGFILMVLPGLVDDDHDDRKLVDLIWFPTGGGKTEAYLGAVAFTILLRRLRFGDDGAGTTAITRYTLRLLTTQQFQRASGLVCALELLRRERRALGDTPITIGLWVGGDSTPNTFQDAQVLLGELRQGEMHSKSFGVTHCAWCGTEVIPSSAPRTKEFDADKRWGVRVDNTTADLFCPDPQCAFHDQLPQQVVDEGIYKTAPTVVIGTIDKFASLAWVADAGCLLGANSMRPPELVIQDELHLISGPLGSVAGLYEAAFDVAMAEMGSKPKIIASTATISRAADHVAALFGRKVAAFPPPGLTADDSFFMSADRKASGRLYLGVMAQGHTPVTANVHASAALLQAPISADPGNPPGDHFWTLVAYHNSLRELGKSTTLARDDTPSRIEVIEPVVERRRAPINVVEITSNVAAAQIPERLAELGLTRTEGGAVDLAACTNMLSVGVDIPRLGLMMVVGQPKSTSEYIQATSRVGREFPGLVVTLYSSAKARDRSHYESFRAYHSALYAAVEGVSVTPTSPRARERALHAALVVIARHALGLGPDASADHFSRNDAHVQRAISALAIRLTEADPGERTEVLSDLERLAIDWNGRVEAAHDAQERLRYKRSGNAGHALLKAFDSTERATGWPTLHSMRGVDAETKINVVRRS